MRTISKILLTAVLFLSVLFSYEKADAYNYHAQWEYDLPFYDCFQYVSTGTVGSLFPSDPYSFINVEQWRGEYSNAYTWTETGWTNGELNGYYWNGFFGAFMQAGEYYEFSIGKENEMSISNSGLYAWSGSTVAFVFGGAAQRLVNTSSNYATDVESGMESNGSYQKFNLFYNGTNESVMQTYAGGPSWYMWPTNPIYLSTLDDSPIHNGYSSVYGYYVDYPNYQVHADWYNN